MQDFFILCKYSTQNNSIIFFFLIFSLSFFKSYGSTGFEIIRLLKAEFSFVINPVFPSLFQEEALGLIQCL